MKKISTNRGFVKMVIIIVIALLVLSYFGINLRSVVNSPTTQDNFGYVASSTTTIWDKYLKNPATYLWNDIFIDVIWNPAIDNIKRLNKGENAEPQLNQPVIPEPSGSN